MIFTHKTLISAIAITTSTFVLADQSGSRLEETVVTANRVETSLREIGSSVSVLTEADLENRGMTLTVQGSYTRNTTAVKKALLTIRKAKPDAVVMVGAYKPVAEFIRLARKIKFNPTFVHISFVGSDALAQELGDAG